MNGIFKMRFGYLAGIGMFLFFAFTFSAFILVQVVGISGENIEKVKYVSVYGALGGFSLVIVGLFLSVYFPSESYEALIRFSHKFYAAGFTIAFIGLSLGMLHINEALAKKIMNFGGVVFAIGIVSSWREGVNQ